MSVSISTETNELDRITQRIKAVLEVATKPQLMLMQLAKGVIAQTQHRIEVEKTSPEGEAWAPWSRDYAATRDAGDSLLIDSREMLDSFSYKVSRSGFTLESSSEYAGYHQTGTADMPARPFFGLSDENARNINEWLEQALLNGQRGVKVKQTTRGKRKRK